MTHEYNLFISWSKQLSKTLAEILRDEMLLVNQGISSFISSDDIRMGRRWQSDLNEVIANVNFGIVCMTPENILEPWIMFEAGAISKSLNYGNVIPILFGLEKGRLPGPLTQFQASYFNKEDMLKVMRAINTSLPKKLDDSTLVSAFGRHWGFMEDKVNKALSDYEDINIADSPEEGHQKEIYRLFKEHGDIIRHISTKVSELHNRSYSRSDNLSNDMYLDFIMKKYRENLYNLRRGTIKDSEFIDEIIRTFLVVERKLDPIRGYTDQSSYLDGNVGMNN